MHEKVYKNNQHQHNFVANNCYSSLFVFCFYRHSWLMESLVYNLRILHVDPDIIWHYVNCSFDNCIFEHQGDLEKNKHGCQHHCNVLSYSFILVSYHECNFIFPRNLCWFLKTQRNNYCGVDFYYHYKRADYFLYLLPNLFGRRKKIEELKRPY